MNFTAEQMEKARRAKTAEELLSFARENGIDMTEEQATEYFAELHKEGELTDDELDIVVGGDGDEKLGTIVSGTSKPSDPADNAYDLTAEAFAANNYNLNGSESVKYNKIIYKLYENDGSSQLVTYHEVNGSGQLFIPRANFQANS